jgi:hypothetical protein
MNKALLVVVETYKAVAHLLPEDVQQQIQQRLGSWEKRQQRAAVSGSSEAAWAMRPNLPPRPLDTRFFTISR